MTTVLRENTDFLVARDRDLVTRMVLRVAGDCTNPLRIPHRGFRDMELAARCRRCASCLRARRHFWRIRAELETLSARRTYFFTGTFRDQSHNIEDVAPEVTKYLKRLRWSLEGKIRYLFVYERHKSGAWHTHALIHGEDELSVSRVGAAWQAGFEYTRRADLSAAGYVTKYVTKSFVERNQTRPRIRASRGYGTAAIERDMDLVRLLKEKGAKEFHEETWTKNLKNLLEDAEKRTRNGDELWNQIAKMKLKG